MILKNELLDYSGWWTGVKFFTSNLTTNAKGELVMGAGNALAVKRLYPDAPAVFGQLLGKYTPDKPLLLQYRVDDDASMMIAAFPTKHHWKDKADIDLIAKGVKQLLDISRQTTFIDFHLPMPGVGLGGLQVGSVLNLIHELPNNVYIYYKR